MGSFAVVFTKNNARIIKDPLNLDILSLYDNVVINPDLSAVTHVPPQFWKLEGDKIVPMTIKEQHARMMDINTNGVDNSVKNIPIKHTKPVKYSSQNLILLVSGLLIGGILGFLIKQLLGLFK